MDTTDPTPYADLGPERILDAIESVGLLPDGRMLALNSYENRVYQIGLDEAAPIVVKFYRPGRWSDAAIAEEHDFATELAEREIPAIAPQRINGDTLHHFAGHRFSISPRRGGRDPELDHPEVLEWVGRFIGRIHAVGASRPFVQRPALDLESFGTRARTRLLEQDWVPTELRETYIEVSANALAAVADCYDRAGPIHNIRLHGDCHRGNLLWTDAGPHFVDFDDARRGPAIQDLWMLLSGYRAEQQRQLADVLAGYEDFCDFDPRELHLVEALRTLRLIHHAGWLARRWQDPAFPAAFPWFATTHYWEQHISQLREQLLAMEAGPLWPV
ncbi:serine/threonine protein kinase [Marichromatium bheemlicum]|uniref:Stress response kinase A n=1 Tax=Marichromatium bheemlicum TaxID=365339 RepID=A0ABX1I895_9GAMM|nr:serine/threonine protein kinase [Marichromatium bheemlicum]NKN33254.1 serine/threonine protein kinase [Marichromatium bheemlicum]